jgi:cobalt-zinc-cadmium efflux system outer membrane protein
MSPVRMAGVRAGFIILIGVLLGGCQSSIHRGASASSASLNKPLDGGPGRESSHAVAPASYESICRLPTIESGHSPPCEDPFAGASELRPEQLVGEVLARNPSLAAATAAWRAAAQKYPQVVSLEDPMFGFMLGPASWESDEVEPGYMLDASQKLPWPGKRQLRGQSALAEATAARFDVDDTRRTLADAARQSLYDLYQARRELELNDENLRIVGEFRDTASAKYRANQVTQQDVLLADVELAELDLRRLELARSERVAIARINTLLHRAADLPLPPPPAHLGAILDLPPPTVLRQLAIDNRPDLAALGAHIRAEQAAVALAHKEFYPDFELVARYDAFWQPHEEDLRPQIGMNVNVPLYQERRRAALREAIFRADQRQAEFEQRVDEIQNDVQVAYERLVEGRQALELYTQKILPATEQSVAEARAQYIAGRVDFLRLVEAQRQAVTFREQRVAIEAGYHRRVADLARAVGFSVKLLEAVEPVPPPSAD